MGRTQGHRRRGGAGRWLAAAAMTVIATASAGCGLLGDDDATPDDDIVEAVTVALEAVGTDGDDPFFDSVAISETTLPDDIATAAIDGILTAKLPPGHADIPEENDYQGTIDSLEVKAGEHTILLQTEDGKTLEITASVPPGRHLVTYFSDEETLTWNNIKLKAAAGASVNVKP